MSVLVEYTVKILVRQDKAPDVEQVCLDDIGEVVVYNYKGGRYLQHETTNVEIIIEEEE